MATNFPTSLDALTNPSGTDSMSSPSHAGQHADANDAIEALQAKVGADGSAVTTSLDYKVSQLETDVDNLESRPVETKTASYTLVAGDVNKRIVMNNAGATTITVNDGVFAAGDTLWIHNIGAGTCTVTAGTATVNTAASLELAQWEGGSLYFTSASSAIFFRGGGAGVGAANFTNTATGTYSSGGKNYKYIRFTSSSTITFDTDGFADILVVGGGGGGGDWTYFTAKGGGGGAGGVLEKTHYVPSGTYTVTIGGGGAGGGNQGDGGTGNLSYISSISYVTGGGGGAGGTGNGAHDGFPGASGGGRGPYGGTGGAGVPGIGNNAGGQGGGGAGAASTGNAGGAGQTSSLTGSSVTYGVGGPGGGSATGSASAANSGNGGTASTLDDGTNAQPGGSGIVVVRVEV